MHPAGSIGRAAAVKAAICSGASKRSIQRWIADFERDGLAGLMRATPSNAGKARVAVSLKFDAAFVEAGYDPAVLPDLGDYLDQIIRSLWASPAAYAGDSRIGDYAGDRLQVECERRGYMLPPAAFSIHTGRVNKWRDYAAINTRRTDAKRAKDALATIERDWRCYDARSVIVIDVHHIKVAVTRADGSTAWPKLIGYFDPATQMIFPHLVLCERDKNISREHVIQGFIRMATHDLWGFPEKLYIDNGSENGALERITPALEMLNKNEGRTIIRAIPYNANSKPIEPLFKRLNRFVFSQMKGFGGSDRKKKTQNVGKALTPFQGTWDEFQTQVYTLIEAFHAKRMSAKWDKKSPNELLQAKIDAGWRPVVANELSLDSAFCERVVRHRGRDGIVFGGQRFTHDQLIVVPKGKKIEFCIPWRADESPIAMIPGQGPIKLLPVYAYAALDKDGARAAARLRKTQKRALRDMEADTVPVDPVEIAASIASRAAPIVISGRAHVLDQGSGVQSLAYAKREADTNRATERTEAERHRAVLDLITVALEKKRNAA